MELDKFLEHHGILGMKWGVRRFQNKDGSLTAAGKRRYEAQNKFIEARNKKILSSPTLTYKYRNKFTQEEINEAMKKMKWERELRNLSMDEVTSGSKWATAMLSYAAVGMTAYSAYNSELGKRVRYAAMTRMLWRK